MATILIDPVPAMGHCNGSLRLASILKHVGYNVVYVIHPTYQEKIEQEGFPYYVVNPFLTPMFASDTYLTYWFDCFTSLFNNNCLHQSLEIVKQYDKVIDDVKPDLILLDSCYIQKSVIYGKYKTKIICFDTMVASKYAPNVPPYKFLFIPRKNILSKKYVDYLWLIYKLNRMLIILRKKILYCNNDSHSIYKKIASVHQVELEHWNKTPRINRTLIVPKILTELILPPQCFDFPRNPDAQLLYIDPVLNPQWDTWNFSERYLAVREHALALKKRNPKMRYIYVSLGTASNASPKREMKFIRTLIRYCKENKEHQFLFSIGKNYDINILGEVPENLNIFKSIPQLDMLKYCDFMITHGGMNTLTECILNEVPVIVYPLVTKANWDQNGNSARVVYHRMGIRGNIRTITVCKLKKCIDTMCTDYLFYKEGVKQLNKQINTQTAVERTVKLFELLFKT